MMIALPSPEPEEKPAIMIPNYDAEQYQSCHANDYTYLIGKHYGEIDRSTLPVRNRIFPFEASATLEFFGDRLNIDTDENGIITSLHCG